MVTGEISSIYKQDGRVRKVHNVILLPGLSEADLLSKKLEAIGNIHSDGRPILGLSSRDLLEITHGNLPARPCLCRRISGRRIFPCSAPFPALTALRSVSGT